VTPTANDLHCAFTVPTPLGDTHCTLRIDDNGLYFASDAALGGGVEQLRWESIKEGATAGMAGMGGRGAPDLAKWIPAQIEWLVLSRTAADQKPFMRVLPTGEEHDAIIAALQQRLGSRWIGERLPLQDAQSRMGISSREWSTFKVAGIVVAVLALLVALILLLSFLFQPVVAIPAGFVAGGWLLHKGFAGLRDGLAATNTPTAKTSSAALGLVELAGRATTNHPSVAAVTGRPSVWWDVAVHRWSDAGNNDGEWRQVAARHGGRVDVVELTDEAGCVPIWLKDADVLLATEVWESRKDSLPAPGVALLEEMGFPWPGDGRIRVSEACLEVNGSLYVIGTLDERRNVTEHVSPRGFAGVVQSVRTGEWRRSVVAAAPGPARIVVAVLIGFLDIIGKVGKGGERIKVADDSSPPEIAPTALLVWKGRTGQPFLVSNRPEQKGLATLRQRSLVFCGFGAVVLCYTLYQLVDLLLGR